MLTSTSSEIATRRRRITSTVTGSIGAATAAAASVASIVAVNIDLPEAADGKRVAGTDQRARSILDDQRRANRGESCAERIAIINIGRQKAIFFQEKDWAHFRPWRVGGASGPGKVGDLRLLHAQRGQ